MDDWAGGMHFDGGMDWDRKIRMDWIDGLGLSSGWAIYRML